MKLADQSKRHSRMIKEKLARDTPVASTPVLSSAAEGRRTVMRSIKLSKGWADESPEWQAMSAKEGRSILHRYVAVANLFTARDGGKGGGRAHRTREARR